MARKASDFCDGISRRNVMQAGLAGSIGLSLSDLLRLKAHSEEIGTTKQDTAVIYLELAEGPTQHETYGPAR